MRYAWLEAHCLSKPGAEKIYKDEWEATLYRVGDKMFLMDGGDKAGAPIISLKLEPGHGLLARGEYPGAVVPGYYMNKTHWNSVYREPEGHVVPDDVLRAYIDESYTLVLSSLSKKQQQALLGSAR